MAKALAALLAAAALAGQDDKAVEEALERFKIAYRSASEAERAGAVAELAKVPHPKTLARLAPLLTTDGNTVRIAAARGLGGFSDLRKATVPLLTGALQPNSKEADVQAAILEALGKLEDESALPSVHKYVEDRDVKVAKAALLAAGQIRSASSIPILIEQVKRMERFVRIKDGTIDAGNVGGYNVPSGEDQNKKRAEELLPPTLKVLQELTRQKFTSSKEWQVWWSENRTTFRVEKP
jgi:HEAT repeat protein